MPEIRILEYLDIKSRSPFAAWFAAGNWSNVKGVGAGVFERKIDAGPGYRVYFGKDGDRLVILLGGSTKQRQQQAIETARDRWADYRRRKGTRS